LWSAVFTQARAPGSDIIGVKGARNHDAFVVRRLSVFINRRQEGRDMTMREEGREGGRQVEKSPKT